MPSFHLDPAEFAPLVEQAVEATLRRIDEQRPVDGSGRLLFNKREAADSLAVSVATLDRLTYPRGDLRAVRLDGRVLYARSELERWIGGKLAEGGI